MTNKKNLHILYLDGEDYPNRGVVTFENEVGTKLLLVIMPNNFRQFENITVTYEAISHKQPKTKGQF